MTGKQKLFLGIGLFTLGAAGWYIHKQYKMSQLLCFKPKKYRLKDIGINSTKVELDIEVQNKGGLAVKVRSYKFRIYGNGKYLATAYSDRESIIKPYSSIIVPVTISINPKLLFKNVGNILISSGDLKNIKLSFNGGLKVTKGIVPLYVPIKAELKLSEITDSNTSESSC